MADRVETSPVSTLQTGTFDISSSIEKPRFVMLYAVDSTKDGDVTKNSFHYDTYIIPGGRQVTRAQLELGMFKSLLPLIDKGEIDISQSGNGFVIRSHPTRSGGAVIPTLKYVLSSNKKRDQVFF